MGRPGHQNTAQVAEEVEVWFGENIARSRTGHDGIRMFIGIGPPSELYTGTIGEQSRRAAGKAERSW